MEDVNRRNERFIISDNALAHQVNQAKELDDGLARIVEAYSRFEKNQEKPTQVFSILDNEQANLQAPHTTTLKSLLSAVAVLNDIEAQYEDAMKDFKSSLLTKSFLKTFVFQSSDSASQVKEFVSQLDSIEAVAYDKFQAYATQAEVVQIKCENAIKTAKVMETFHSKNYDLMQKDEAWARKYLEMLESPTLSTVSDCISEERLNTLAETYYIKKVEQIRSTIPSINDIKSNLDQLSELKKRTVSIYEADPQRIETIATR